MDHQRRLVPGEGGAQHDPDQTDGHQAASQSDRLMENAEPSRDGSLLNPHEADGHGTHPVDISWLHAARQSSRLRSREWKEFDIIESTLTRSPIRAKCIHCDVELSCPTNQGIGVITRHLKTNACLSKRSGGSDPLRTYGATTNPATGNSSSRKGRKPKTNRRKKDDFSKEKYDILGANPKELPCDSENPSDECSLMIHQIAQRGTLLDPHETDGHGTKPVEILTGHAATQSRSISRLRAEAWKEFEIIEFTLTGSPVRAKCIHCDVKLRCPTNQGLGVLSRHLETNACLSKRSGGSDPLRATGNSFSRKRKAHTNQRNKDDFSKEILRDIPGGKQLRR